jgi:hypothetical protein
MGQRTKPQRKSSNRIASESSSTSCHYQGARHYKDARWYQSHWSGSCQLPLIYLFHTDNPQLVVALYQTLLDYYGALSPEILSLHPDNLGTARASDNILIAHLVFKSLSQLSQWLFSQVGKKDPEFQVFNPAVCEHYNVTFVILIFMSIVAKLLSRICDSNTKAG